MRMMNTILLAVVAVVVAARVQAATIYGCANARTGRLRSIGLNPPNCKPSEALTSWQQQGPVGPPGPQGNPATGLWAVVDARGTLVRGSGVVSTSYREQGCNCERAGYYTVTFNRAINHCARLATLAADSPSSFDGVGVPMITVVDSVTLSVQLVVNRPGISGDSLS